MSEIQIRDTGQGPFQVHESAYIDEGCSIGAGTTIWHYSHIMKQAEIGRDCRIGQNVLVCSTARVGNQVKIQNNVSVYDRVILEDGVFCGPSCVFTNVINPRAFIERKHEYRETRVRQGATIGANATIVCGVTLGRYCLVGAGAVVTRDIPDHALVYGSPARRQGWVCECGHTLDTELKCSLCHSSYHQTEEGLEKNEI